MDGPLATGLWTRCLLLPRDNFGAIVGRRREKPEFRSATAHILGCPPPISTDNPPTTTATTHKRHAAQLRNPVAFVVVASIGSVKKLCEDDYAIGYEQSVVGLSPGETS